VERETDPATPRFAADEPRVVSTPFGTLDDEHPLRRAIGSIDFPASTERVLDVVRADPLVDAEQVRWLTGVLPADRTFSDEDELVAALGTWGPPPPTTPPAL